MFLDCYEYCTLFVPAIVVEVVVVVVKEVEVVEAVVVDMVVVVGIVAPEGLMSKCHLSDL